ncbi:MAG: hypothetical protein ACRERV_10885, partial [Methylococcales bacterium]
MATKEDILEQVVEEYLIHRGYFVIHNIKYRPDKNHSHFNPQKDSNHSDIDVVGVHPLKSGPERVVVVSCKSWQGGFNVSAKLEEIAKNKKVSGRDAWKGFRELTKKKWSVAFCKAVERVSGSKMFTHILAVTKVKGDRLLWENHKVFREAIGGNPLKIVTFEEMISAIDKNLTKT